MQSPPRSTLVVVLGTGGTIAGEAAAPEAERGYRSAAIGVDALVASARADASIRVESEQVAQLDSKDMDFATWQRLAHRVAHHLGRAEVAGVVVTHGTDTLEETAWFLARLVLPAKPVVLTAAMRPATSRQADGPRNLADAIGVAARWPAAGVVVVLGGTVHAARHVRKVHPTRLDAFSSGEAGPLARIEGDTVHRLGSDPARQATVGLASLPADAASWPWVETVGSGAGAGDRAVDALVGAGVDGLVVAATGNGMLHVGLEGALVAAAAAGVAVLRSSRCGDGAILEDAPGPLAHAGDLNPPKARVELILRLLEARPR